MATYSERDNFRKISVKAGAINQTNYFVGLSCWFAIK